MPSYFTHRLLLWYNENARDLPWRTSRDPYVIWLSEIILQQTRVEQGLPYFSLFVDRFPTVFDLAKASESDVLKCWQGLGYYSRARNLHHTAAAIAENNGLFPDSYAKLLKLKGVGAYTAAAIASFAFNEPVPVVDGNVYRFISRFFGINMPIGTVASHRFFTGVLMDLIPKQSPAQFNQALMEFGALQCVPGVPNCQACPFLQDCVARQSDNVSSYPVKQKVSAVKNLYFHFIDIRSGQNTWIEQRKKKGIWNQLWHFPLFEWNADLTEHEGLIKIADFLEMPVEAIELNESWTTIHLLTHRKIHARFWKLVTTIEPLKEDLLKINFTCLETYPMPQLMVKYLSK